MAAEQAPQAMGGLFSDVADRPQRAQQLAEMLAQTKDENAARAKRVLKHADLRERLRAVGISNPGSWNGWIPPKSGQEETCVDCGRPPRKVGRGRNSVTQLPRCEHSDHFAAHNDSPRRRALVEIAAEALRREQEA